MDLNTSRFAKIVESLQNEAESGGSEKRRATRAAVHAKVPAAVLVGGQLTHRYSAMTHDISSSGIGLLQTMPVDPATQVVVELPEGRATSLFIGVVRHCRAAANGIFAVGLEFTAEAPPELAKTWSKDERAELKRIQDSMLGP